MGLGWGRMSGRRLPTHEYPRDSFLLPLWKEQTFHAATGRNLPGLLFLQGWLFVRKRHTGGTKNLGLGKGSLPQRGQSAVGGTALTPGMEKTCRGPTPDSSLPPLREEKRRAKDLLLTHHRHPSEKSKPSGAMENSRGLKSEHLYQETFLYSISFFS